MCIKDSSPVLETDRLILRKLKPDDLEDMFRYGSNPEVSKFVTWPTHQSIEETKGFLDHILKQYETDSIAFWGIELKETHRLIGTIDFVTLSPAHKKGEIGYVLSQEYWGRGLMTEAAKQVIKFGFEKMNLVRIEARTLVENIGSEQVMKKAGMTFEGIMRKAMLTKGKHRDIKLYSILREEFISKEKDS